MVVIRIWNSKGDHWQYIRFDTEEDFEEYLTDTGLKPEAVKRDKGKWTYDQR